MAALQLDEKTQALWDWFNGAPIHIVTILVTATLAQYLGSKAIRRSVNRIASADLIPGPRNLAFRQAERARTVGTVLSSSLNATIWIVALFMLLGELGLNLGPLIASAGVIGVALGLGAQTIVRDVLSGILMLIEDQYGVGDDVKVQDVEGNDVAAADFAQDVFHWDRHIVEIHGGGRAALDAHLLFDAIKPRRKQGGKGQMRVEVSATHPALNTDRLAVRPANAEARGAVVEAPHRAGGREGVCLVLETADRDQCHCRLFL